MEKKMPTNVVLRNIFRALVLIAAFAELGTAVARAQVTYTDLYKLGIPAGIGGITLTGEQVAAGGQVVGWGPSTATPKDHALLWTGPTGSAVDLNPTGFTVSQAQGTNGTPAGGLGQGPGGDRRGTITPCSGTAPLAVPST